MQAGNGAEALEAYQTWHPDLILMDNRMPVMNGTEATLQIRATEQGKALPIIAVTASAFEEDRQKILAQGASDFIRKPLRDQELLDKIGQQLNVSYVYGETQ